MVNSLWPSIRHTGGLAISFFDIDGKVLGNGNIAMEDQPLSEYAKAVMRQVFNLGDDSYFEITRFSPEKSEMDVTIEATSN